MEPEQLWSSRLVSENIILVLALPQCGKVAQMLQVKGALGRGEGVCAEPRGQHGQLLRTECTSAREWKASPCARLDLSKVLLGFLKLVSEGSRDRHWGL